MRKSPGADARPRIHIWPQGYGPRWSVGPTGTRIPAKTIGEAVEQALRSIDDRRGAVIVLEPLS